MVVKTRWCTSISPDEAESLFLQMGEYVLRFESEEFGAEYEERARLELRETPEQTKEAVAKLRELLKGELIGVLQGRCANRVNGHPVWQGQAGQPAGLAVPSCEERTAIRCASLHCRTRLRIVCFEGSKR